MNIIPKSSSKLKHKFDRDFTIAPNIIFLDDRLSYKAKGLWLQIISLPDGWSFSIRGLAALAKENEKAIKSGLEELKALKYIEWYKTQNEKGQFTVVVNTLLPAKTPYGKTSTGQNATWRNADNKEYKNKESNSYKESNNGTDSGLLISQPVPNQEDHRGKASPAKEALREMWSKPKQKANA